MYAYPMQHMVRGKYDIGNMILLSTLLKYALHFQ